MPELRRCSAAVGLWIAAFVWFPPNPAIATAPDAGNRLDAELASVLAASGFTGSIEATLPARLGRPLDPALADVGRLLFFDNVLGLHEDNSCAGCHSPAFGFGDSQSIAIGTQNNGLVGPDRSGPRNQRKAPVVINSGFFPRLMLNSRFFAVSGDPFDNSQGFQFPSPEGLVKFPPGDPLTRTLLAAQGQIPPTELVEMAGFTGASQNPLLSPIFHQFDDGLGERLPTDHDGDGFLNEEIRSAVLKKLNRIPEYHQRLADLFNGGRIQGFKIDFSHVGRALAEFQLSLTLASSPLDRFARGEHSAMTRDEKQGALIFFGAARCVECHAVGGASNEMFSDFANHVLGVPQVAPFFGAGSGNMVFDGPGGDEDFGAEQISGDAEDRYKFRTSPLRNAAVQPAFFHNGAFTSLEDAIRHHLDVVPSARHYNPSAAGIDSDLAQRLGPIEPVLARLDPIVQTPIRLSSRDFANLVAFVRHALLDPRALPGGLCALTPETVPSGLPVLDFQGCE